MAILEAKLFRERCGGWAIVGLLLLGVVVLFSSRSFSVDTINGFNLGNLSVPRELIFHGGPPRDGIPAIDNPQFVSVAQAIFLNPEDRVLGLEFDGMVRAYPIRILNYHEIVNDRINEQAIVISYCPLCGSGIAFKPEGLGYETSFGVSGLLYNSDMLLYDRETESLWSQILGTAISGNLKGKKLMTLVMVNTTWSHWKQQHPESKVLSPQTGYHRDYNQHPYGDYDSNRAIYFPVENTNMRFHPKERVIGITLDGQAKAYPLSMLEKHRRNRFIDRFAGRSLTVEYDKNSQSAVIYSDDNEPVPSTMLFWFAWVAFYPDTEIFTVQQGGTRK